MELFIDVPYPYVKDDCEGCVLWSDVDQCCHAADAEECAAVNGLLV